MRKYQQLCFELRERREGYTVIMIPTVIGCLGGGIKELKANIKRIFDYHNKKDWKDSIWTVDMRCLYYLANKFW